MRDEATSEGLEGTPGVSGGGAKGKRDNVTCVLNWVGGGEAWS